MSKHDAVASAAALVARGGAVRLLVGCLAAAVVLSLHGAAFTQTPRPAAAPAPQPVAPAKPTADAPDSTTERFGDWSLVCANVNGDQRCEVSLPLRDKQSQPVALLAIGRVAKDQPMKMTLRVAVNVMVNVPARLQMDGVDSAVLVFRSCNQLGCFAEMEMADDALLRKLRARGPDQRGRLVWLDPAASEIAAVVAVRGLGGALDGLARHGK